MAKRWCPETQWDRATRCCLYEQRSKLLAIYSVSCSKLLSPLISCAFKERNRGVVLCTEPYGYVCGVLRQHLLCASPFYHSEFWFWVTAVHHCVCSRVVGLCDGTQKKKTTTTMTGLQCTEPTLNPHCLFLNPLFWILFLRIQLGWILTSASHLCLWATHFAWI